VRDKLLPSADEAAALIPDGATVMFGGFIAAGPAADMASIQDDHRENTDYS
jgi:acyl CoA:acetate/3-ketoacid CoA transferase alpha subunit